ncbi:MAG: hypothetical protein ETSY2_50165 [Candidatus Entotheonella gemina]|uniref:Uncharacterized protein n=1 Tax=Candidatus Entotheonella gemina TaxID=1429439 RepID=W4L940_9BACT|nr:MAG: hypothetical protein ETSY2_50165 [Candidatus Entotheonella gemina]
MGKKPAKLSIFVNTILEMGDNMRSRFVMSMFFNKIRERLLYNRLQLTFLIYRDTPHFSKNSGIYLS